MAIPAAGSPAGALATPDDVADEWRPLSTDETATATRLITKASAMLRQKLPAVDARMAAFSANTADPTGLDPALVASVVARMVKRVLSNPQGIASESVGPYSVSYALRGEKEARGELQVTDADLKDLVPYRSKKSRVGSIKARPALAPWPIGDLGPLGPGFGVYDPLLTGTDPTGGEFPYFPDRSDTV